MMGLLLQLSHLPKADPRFYNPRTEVGIHTMFCHRNGTRLRENQLCTINHVQYYVGFVCSVY